MHKKCLNYSQTNVCLKVWGLDQPLNEQDRMRQYKRNYCTQVYSIIKLGMKPNAELNHELIWLLTQCYSAHCSKMCPLPTTTLYWPKFKKYPPRLNTLIGKINRIEIHHSTLVYILNLSWDFYNTPNLSSLWKIQNINSYWLGMIIWCVFFFYFWRSLNKLITPMFI